MHILRCAVPVEAPTGIATRPVFGDGGALALQHTLLSTGTGQLITLLGADNRHGLDVGHALDLFGSSEEGSDMVPFGYTMDALRGPVWDAFSSCLFVIHGNALLRMDDDDCVSPVAGHFQEVGTVDGHGASARFRDPNLLASDGAGNLYVADAGRIRRVQLPAAWGKNASPSENQCLNIFPLTVPLRGSPRRFASVTTLPLASEVRLYSEICGLAYHAADAVGSYHNTGSGGAGGTGGRGPAADGSISGAGGGDGCLIFATASAVYRLPLPSEGDWIAAAGRAPAVSSAISSFASTPMNSARQEETPASPAATGAATPSFLAALTTIATRAAITSTITGNNNNNNDSSSNGSNSAYRTVVLTPVRLAGLEEEAGLVDGPGSEARFRCITGLALDTDGAVYVIDYVASDDSSAVRRIAPDGTVTTLVVGLKNRLVRPAVLPNGYLALCDQWSDALVLLDLGLSAAHAAPAATAAAVAATAGVVPAGLLPYTCSLAADLGALLDRQPDGTADLAIVVGGRTFAVHRAILMARCDYFRRRLAGGFAEGSSGAAGASPPPAAAPATLPLLPPRSPSPCPSPQLRSPQRPLPQPPPPPLMPPAQYASQSSLHQRQQQQRPPPSLPPAPPTPLPHLQHQVPQPQPLTLPDADPDAFELILRYIYTGALHVPSEIAPEVAELADRLLLPELCAAAQAQVLAEVRPETVVGALLWAEALGPAFCSLLSELKSWYLDHHEEVVERAPGSVKRLMVERCELMMELHFNYKKRLRGR